MLNGFLASSWQTLASSEQTTPKSDSKRGYSRIQQTLSALHIFICALWLGGNQVLHAETDTAVAIRYSAESAELRLPLLRHHP